ncbi:PE domain-containing protein, partial [Mycobacterium sp. Lab-001]|uniref:PE domain-containing protein n=1 Tax=Mycobacterium sp. Lab-001 TaxID=3410136 RepID=UPI003D16EC9E
MSFLVSDPSALAAAAADVGGIGVQLRAATAAASPITSVASAAADEVSQSIAALFGSYGREYGALLAQAAAFHVSMERTLTSAAELYVSAEASNASPLQNGVQALRGIFSAFPGGNGGQLASSAGAGAHAANAAASSSGSSASAATTMSSAATPSPSANAPGVSATFTATLQWNNGFTGDYTITNTGSTPLTNWQAQFNLPSNESISNAWNAQIS